MPRFDHNTQITVITADEALYHFLKLSDSIEMNVDGSSAVKNFDYTTTERDVVFRLNIHSVDDVKWDADGFFSLPALTNGMLIQVVDTDGSTILQHFGTDDEPIKRHADLYSLAGIDINDDSAGNTSSAGARWTIQKAGFPIELTTGQIIRVVIQDNLEAFVQFRAMMQGSKL